MDTLQCALNLVATTIGAVMLWHGLKSPVGYLDFIVSVAVGGSVSCAGVILLAARFLR